MEYQNLGRTGLKISRLVFGGLHLGETLTDDQAAAVFKAVWDSGVNTFYTADVYGHGAAEEALGSLVRPHREDSVLIIKAGYPVGARTSPNARGLSRKHLTQALDASLTRLGTDYIDVYCPHFWDDETPVEETLETLDGFVRAGKVRYLGASQTAPWQLYRALWASDKLALNRYECVQTRVNLLERGALDDYFPAAKAAGVSVLAHQSLAGGLLTGAFAGTADKPSGLGSLQRYTDMYWNESTFRFLDRLASVARSCGRTLGELSQAWLLAQQPVAGLLIGPNTPDELPAQVSAADKPLTAEEGAAIDALLDETG